MVASVLRSALRHAVASRGVRDRGGCRVHGRRSPASSGADKCPRLS